MRLLRLERINENVTEAALVLICLTSLSVLLLRLAPHGDIARGSKAHDLVVTRVRVEVGVCVP